MWFLARTVRAPIQPIAALELPVAAVTAAELQCESAPEPNYAEHGVIIGWDIDTKPKRLAASQALVAAVTAVRWPPSVTPA
jgi:hypothetical protein